MYGRVCEFCGAHLDPAEHCDCINEKKKLEARYEEILETEETGQMVLREACA